MTLRIDNYNQGFGADGVESGSIGASAAAATTAGSAQMGANEAGRLPEPLESFASGGDLVTELTALLTLASQNDRDVARQAQRAEDMLRTQQEHLKVQKMHEQADAIRAQGWSEGLAEIGQGACQVTAGLTVDKSRQLDWHDVSLAMDKGFSGAGALVSGQYKASERLAQADAEEAGANADRAGRGSKEAADDVDGARDMLKKIASFYEQMQEAQSASMNAAANFRA